jgi:hypothetical protein
LAVGAVSGELHLGACYLKAVPILDVREHFVYYRTLYFNNFAARLANQVIVSILVCQLIVVVVLIQVQLADQARLLEAV